MSELKLKIKKIGQRMVACTAKCKGIRCDQKAGIIPRCLVLEDANRALSNGCVVIGINPGTADRTERNFYKVSKATYKSLLKYWDKDISKRRYYKSIRELIDALNLPGPILWSELAKCQSWTKQRLPPLSTLRKCTGMYLMDELDAVPQKWPIIALGREASHALAYMYPRRTVIGIPHPTGSFGHFSRLKKNGQLASKMRKQIRETLSRHHGEILWLRRGKKKITKRII